MSVKVIDRADLDDILAVQSIAFGDRPTADRTAHERDVFDAERSLAAFDGERIVGALSGREFELSVPGGRLPCEWITGLAVAPTDRRRGIARELITRHLHGRAEAGASAVGLWASEGGVYRPYGFGIATVSCGIHVERSRAALVSSADQGTGLRVVPVEAEQSYADLHSAHDQARGRPGMLSRDDVWWRYRFARPMIGEGVNPILFCACEGEEGVEGYLAYRLTISWQGKIPTGRLEVEELIASTARAYRALWGFCLDMDLATTIEAPNEPPDSALFWLLAEPRLLRMTARDGVWMRLLDVPRALTSRTYLTEGRLVLEVRDELCPWNGGRFELEFGPGGSECSRSTKTPHLMLDVGTLGAAFLGEPSAAGLWQAGLIEAGETDASAWRAFVGAESPWSPYLF
jgi:predicted acetyltransferase